MPTATLIDLATRLGAELKARQLTVTTAESCTGGGVAHAITAIPGSSAWFHQGWVTYSNTAKTEQLGVDADTLASFGAVSEPVVVAMALGARLRSGSDLAVAISGIAGPDGGTPDKPVGTVCIAWASPVSLHAATLQLNGDRHQVREHSVQAALQGLLECASALPMGETA